MSVARQTDPVTVDEHFSHLLIAQVFSCQLLELLDTPILQLVNDIS